MCHLSARREAAKDFRHVLAGIKCNLNKTDKKNKLFVEEKVVGLLERFVLVHISTTMPNDDLRGNDCTCARYAKYATCWHILAVQHHMGTINLDELLANPFPANKRRSTATTRSRHQQVILDPHIV